MTNWKPTGVSPFALTYGMEAIIPIEIGMPTLRTKIPEENNVEAVTKYLDMTNELREVAVVHITSYQRRLTNLYNRRVKPRTFQDGNLFLRRVFENTANLADKKFQQNWEGPYTVVRVVTAGSYC